MHTHDTTKIDATITVDVMGVACKVSTGGAYARLPAQAPKVKAMSPGELRNTKDRTREERDFVRAYDAARARMLTNICPECLSRFTPKGPRQTFCSPAHRAAWESRVTVRGKKLLTSEMAARIPRGGTDHAKRARDTATNLKDEWTTEDRVEGRMSMEDYEFLRFHLGFGL